MCECVGTSVTTIHPRHRPHHRYIITLSVCVCVLDNSNAELLTPPPARLSGSAVLPLA